MTEEQSPRENPIEGKVASILNERELAINIGRCDGVRRGMKFKILAETPTEISDPDTGENLGIVDREKVRVQATEVQERFSICRTYKTRHVAGGLFPSLSWLVSEPREVSETLKAEDSSLPPPLPEEESYVKNGDRVVQVVE